MCRSFVNRILICLLRFTIIGFSVMLASCMDSDSASKPFWTVGRISSHGLGKRGHEYLLQFGVQNANQILEESGLWKGHFFPENPKFENGYDSRNDLVRGNYLTDFPDQSRPNELDLRLLFHIDRNSDWHTDPKVQRLHFLRSYSRDLKTLESVPNTIHSAIQTILHMSQRAFGLWETDRRLALQHLGIATHIIQDGFSLAHVSRKSQDDWFKISDICTFGSKWPGVCYHGVVDGNQNIMDDIVWDYSKCIGSESESCLKENAMKAVETTAGFLTTFAEVLIIDGESELLNKSLTDFFGVKNSRVGSGYFGDFEIRL